LPKSLDGYSLLLASDVLERDGLGLELYGPGDQLIAEVFRDDNDEGSRAMTVHVDSPIPLDVVTWFLATANERL
jgi:hypothetical protein